MAIGSDSPWSRVRSTSIDFQEEERRSHSHSSGGPSADYKMQDQRDHSEKPQQMNQPTATWNIVEPPTQAINRTTNKIVQMLIVTLSKIEISFPNSQLS